MTQASILKYVAIVLFGYLGLDLLTFILGGIVYHGYLKKHPPKLPEELQNIYRTHHQNENSNTNKEKKE